MQLSDLLDLNLLEAHLAHGYVRQQAHPTLPLVILNYTHAAQWDRAWDPITCQCRGLIVDDEGEVVARPWEKFFNYGEFDEGVLDLDAPVTVRDKLDGSLGIMYPDPTQPSGYAIATRGSFTSEQALRGTELLQSYLLYSAPGELPVTRWTPLLGITYLFEIIYPENRIVLDYDGRSELVLLGVVETDTGMQDHGDVTWPGPIAAFHSAKTMAEALAIEPRPNAEGIVVTYKDSGLMVKIKQEDYVALHRLVTGLNEKTVWEHAAAGGELAELLAPLPEEFHPWVLGVWGNLQGAYRSIVMDARDEYGIVVGDLLVGGASIDRKDFAERAKAYAPGPHLLFMLFDGKPIDEAVWKMVKPKGARSLVPTSEDTA